MTIRVLPESHARPLFPGLKKFHKQFVLHSLDAELNLATADFFIIRGSCLERTAVEEERLTPPLPASCRKTGSVGRLGKMSLCNFVPDFLTSPQISIALLSGFYAARYYVVKSSCSCALRRTSARTLQKI